MSELSSQGSRHRRSDSPHRRRRRSSSAGSSASSSDGSRSRRRAARRSRRPRVIRHAPEYEPPGWSIAAEYQDDVDLSEVLRSLAQRRTGMLQYHESRSCNRCRMGPVVGPMLHCLQCYDYDLCVTCFGSDDHRFDGHILELWTMPYAPVHVAAQLGDVDALRVLRRCGYDMEEAMLSHYGHAPIHLAAITGQVHVLDWLINQCGVSPHVPCRMQLPFHLAVRNKQLHAARFLARAGLRDITSARTTIYRGVIKSHCLDDDDFDPDNMAALLDLAVSTTYLGITPVRLLRMALAHSGRRLAEFVIHRYSIPAATLAEHRLVFMIDAICSGVLATVMYVQDSGVFSWAPGDAGNLAVRLRRSYVYFPAARDMRVVDYILQLPGVNLVHSESLFNRMQWFERATTADLAWMLAQPGVNVNYFLGHGKDPQRAFAYVHVLEWLLAQPQHFTLMPFHVRSAIRCGSVPCLKMLDLMIQRQRGRSLREFLGFPPWTSLQPDRRLNELLERAIDCRNQYVELLSDPERMETDVDKGNRLIVLRDRFDAASAAFVKAEVDAPGVAPAALSLVLSACESIDSLTYLHNRYCVPMTRFSPAQRVKLLNVALRCPPSVLEFILARIPMESMSDRELAHVMLSLVAIPDSNAAVLTYLENAKYLTRFLSFERRIDSVVRTIMRDTYFTRLEPDEVNLHRARLAMPSLRSLKWPEPPLAPLTYLFTSSPLADLYRRLFASSVELEYLPGRAGNPGYPSALHHLLTLLPPQIHSLTLTMPRNAAIHHVGIGSTITTCNIQLPIRPSVMVLPPSISRLRSLRLFTFTAALRNAFEPLALDALATLPELTTVNITGLFYPLPSSMLSMQSLRLITATAVYWRQDTDTSLTDLAQPVPLPSLLKLALVAVASAGGVSSSDCVPREITARVAQPAAFTCMLCSRPGWSEDLLHFVSPALLVQNRAAVPCDHAAHENEEIHRSVQQAAIPRLPICVFPTVQRRIGVPSGLPVRVRMHSWCWLAQRDTLRDLVTEPEPGCRVIWTDAGPEQILVDDLSVPADPRVWLLPDQPEPVI